MSKKKKISRSQFLRITQLKPNATKETQKLKNHPHQNLFPKRPYKIYLDISFREPRDVKEEAVALLRLHYVHRHAPPPSLVPLIPPAGPAPVPVGGATCQPLESLRQVEQLVHRVEQHRVSKRAHLDITFLSLSLYQL